MDISMRRAIMMGGKKKEYIVFADPTVESICIANWSSDGIGVTMEDAAAASVGTTFKGNTTITSFDELKYFKASGCVSNMFQGCTALRSVSLPAGIGYLQYLFNGCSNLEELTIMGNRGTSQISFAGYSFNGCSLLKRVNVPSESVWIMRGFSQYNRNAVYSPFDVSKDGHLYINNTEVTHFVIPSGTTTIQQGQFRYVLGITEITIPSSLTTSNSHAFYGAVNIARVNISDLAAYLNITFNNNKQSNPFGDSSTATKGLYLNGNVIENLVIPNNITTIKNYAFVENNTIKSITFPSTVTNIGTYAFSGCTGLVGTLTIPSSITTIGSNAFGNTTNINLIVVNASCSLQGFAESSKVANGKLVVNGDATGYTNGYFGFKEIDIQGNFISAGTATSHQFGKSGTNTYNFVLRIGGDASFNSSGQEIYNQDLIFFEVLGDITATGGGLWSRSKAGCIYHLGKNGIVSATPAYLKVSSTNITKIYVGDGTSQAGDQAVLDLYLADTDWAQYSDKLDTWYNYLHELPSGYTRLEYVKTDSTAYIDTGVNGDSDNLIIHTIYLCENHVQYGNIFSNYSAESANCWRVILNTSSTVYITTNRIASTSKSVNSAINTIHNTELSLLKFEDNGTVSTYTANSGSVNTSTIVLGNRPDYVYRDIGLRIYSFKIKDGNTTLLNYIPCLNPNNVVGFYDTVSNTFKPSDTASPFIAGPEDIRGL